MIFRIITIALILFLTGCSSFRKADISNLEKFEIGISYFNDKKYQKSKEIFNEILEDEQGTNTALESTYFLARTLYELDEFDEASYNFNYFSMFSKDIEKVEFSQFMKSKCAFDQSLPYNKDQSLSLYAISIIQEFLDNFPYSIYKDDAYNMIVDLRNRIGRKNFEAGRLYLKKKMYDSALYYFDIIIDEFYDTIYYDEALISYIFSYIIMNEYDKGKSFFEMVKSNFKDQKKLAEAEQILKDYKDGLGISGLYRLYK
tara:strand:- start:6758 stop:7531 length:774 start_codon:yes stop_codon:yes gene_type:complete